ncbi:uncharacterized protein CC84DRAFT_1216993 [Paraphaeosphaeria sporulosa]|uniref:Uncharacterized protein n=1 Tax=Paraphaeosphaeria sporulosa TaxID=1460663 RepID=A0A177CED0_9PLEO|nr:uncharacterized protein CC84DRAFT_1216993 [Paraphaeosphaeria sporulosa]OAG05666.1 hypothetical protein CC84DRAFT_1216993 [Paraphaeosphaeria sporulosa]
MPWPAHRTAIPEPIHHLIQQKAAELATLRAEVERELLLVTLLADPFKQKPRHLDPRNASEIESWLPVQLFRDKLAQHISDVSKYASPSLHFGRLYRRIHRGDWNWMFTEYIWEMLESVINRSERTGGMTCGS